MLGMGTSAMDLDTIELNVGRAHGIVQALSQGRRKWDISIPARPDHDPDLIIGQALRDADDMIKELRSRIPKPDAPKAGTLEVGVNERGEVVVNHPSLEVDAAGCGHIVFSPEQARGLAGFLLKHADEAERILLGPSNG